MKVVKKKDSTSKSIDPLYAIFEQHLFNFADPDSDRKTFISGVVSDYLVYLRKNNVIVPKSLEQPIHDELGAQVNTMLVKKIYGCLNVQDYQGGVPAMAKRRSRARHSRVSRGSTRRTTKSAGEKKTG